MNRRGGWRPAQLALFALAALSAPLRADAPSGNCGADWWKRVYSPKRFVIQNPCVTVRGVVTLVRHPLDGDAIVIVKLDPKDAHLSNKRNEEGYGKDTLELEIVCRHPVFKLFVRRCWGCKNTMTVPKVGDHVEADGFYVLDKNHGHMESIL
jgi:hypothetical protein